LKIFKYFQKGKHGTQERYKARVMAEKEKNINIAISEESHTRAKIISTIKKTKMKDYLRKIVEDAIKKDEQVLQRIK